MSSLIQHSSVVTRRDEGTDRNPTKDRQTWQIIHYAEAGPYSTMFIQAIHPLTGKPCREETSKIVP